MRSYQDLIEENRILRERLALAQGWMRREVRASAAHIGRDRVHASVRSHFSNIFEQEGIKMLERHIDWLFGSRLDTAPEHTRRRLIDAEIYWYTLQKYPTLDAFPILAAYQKIFDAWIEACLVDPWRISIRDTRFDTVHTSIEQDLARIHQKNFSLSIGRLYRILSRIRSDEMCGPYESHLRWFWKIHAQKHQESLLSDTCFTYLQSLVSQGMFGKKRHETKVSFRDAQNLREAFLGRGGIFDSIF